MMMTTKLNMTAAVSTSATPHPIPGTARAFVLRATSRMLINDHHHPNHPYF